MHSIMHEFEGGGINSKPVKVQHNVTCHVFCIVRGIMIPKTFNHPRFTKRNPITNRSRLLVHSCVPR